MRIPSTSYYIDCVAYHIDLGLCRGQSHLVQVVVEVGPAVQHSRRDTAQVTRKDLAQPRHDATWAATTSRRGSSWGHRPVVLMTPTPSPRQRETGVQGNIRG